MNKIFLTTTLPYANSVPHIGHALEFIQASAIKRFLTSRGDDVFLNVGIDEHGQKMFNAGGGNSGLDVMLHCDEMARVWTDFCFKFDIEFDRFYRTTSEEHKKNVAEFWNKLVRSGDIYMAPYEAVYCQGCESFKTDTEIVDGKCPDHPTTELTKVSEMNYFFALSKYVVNLLSNDKLLLFPKVKRTELQNLIADAKDVSISRSSDKVSWGIKVPNDDMQTIYVWFEALLNYLFSQGERGWEESREIIQLCGPDNIRFQGVLWQAMLLAGKHRPTDYLLVHGTVLDGNGNKMSKSLGNVISPMDLLDKHGLSSVRYYALKGLNTFENSSWDEQAQVRLYNSDLANNYGNLLARTVHLMDLNSMTAPIGKIQFGKYKVIDTAKIKYDDYMAEFQLRLALEQAMEMLSYGNTIMNSQRPWEAESTNKEEILRELWWILSAATDMLSIALSAQDIAMVRKSLNEVKKIIVFPKK